MRETSPAHDARSNRSRKTRKIAVAKPRQQVFMNRRLVAIPHAAIIRPGDAAARRPPRPGHATELSRNLPTPGRTFELGRVVSAANRLILLKTLKLSTKLAQFPACGENGRRERKNGLQLTGAVPSPFGECLEITPFKRTKRTAERISAEVRSGGGKEPPI